MGNGRMANYNPRSPMRNSIIEWKKNRDAIGEEEFYNNEFLEDKPEHIQIY